MDEIYEQLFTIYKSNYQDYLKEVESAKEIISKLKPSAPEHYRPYPKITDQKFYPKLIAKKEFQKYALEEETPKDFDIAANEKCSLADFKLTHNQKFVKNFLSPMTPYNSLLLFHSVGVGKTCSAISIAEQYLLENPDKRVLVILSSNIKENFKKQLFDISKYNIKTHESLQCTGTKYPDMVIDRKFLSSAELNKRIRKIIKERYQFIGLIELANHIERIEKYVHRVEKNPEKYEQRIKEKVSEYFSHRLIIVDEAHNLRIPPAKGAKKISATMQYILENSENTKLVMLTATPMFNSANEITYLLNLFHMNDKRPTKLSGLFHKDGTLKENGVSILKKAAKGYISYMTSANPFTFPFRLYPSINKDSRILKVNDLELLESKMSDKQKQVYPNTEFIINEEDEDEDNEMLNTIQMSNIVYPAEPYYGESAFSECFRKGKDIRYIDKEEFLRYDKISEYSPKIKSILDNVINSKGILLIYSQYIYSGIYPLALALEHIGFMKYGSTNIGANLTVDNKFKKAPGYIVLTRDQLLSHNNAREIEIAKSPENINGELIKVIIVSSVGTEGIDLKYIREVHILEPWFNLNRIEQVIGRAVRTCSHIALPKEERNVTIYMHACTLPKEESIDIKTYKLAARKQKTIKQVERILQESAVDCNLNIHGLTYPASRLKMTIDLHTSQGKIIKKYPVGGLGDEILKCDPIITLDKTETTTFHPLFIVDDIDLYKRYVAKLFREFRELTFSNILNHLQKTYNNIEEETLAYALQEMVDTKYKFLNSLERFGYLQYRGLSYIFQDANQHEIRMSMEERISMKKASKIEVIPLIDHEKTETPQKKTIKVNTVEKIEDLKNTFRKHSHSLNITDAILDRLDIVDLQYVFKNPNFDREIYNALINSPYIVNNTYINKGGEVYNIDTLEMLGPLAKQRLTLPTFQIPAKYYGFLKDGAFKVKDSDKNKGFICRQTSTFKTSTIIEKINELYPGLVPVDNKSYVKAALCDIYELVLREKGLFLRT